MKHNIVLAVAISLLCLPGLTHASPIVRSGEVVSVEKDQVLEGDFYALGSTVTISGEADEDVYVAGSSVTINAPVKKDLVIGGGEVQIHAPVTDDVRIIGGNVTVAGEIGGDLLVLGGLVKILSTASIKGDVIFASGDIDVSGPVTGSIFGAGERVRIDSEVKGNVRVTAKQQLSLGERAIINGNLEYRSIKEVVRSMNAIVLGDIQKKMLITKEQTSAFGIMLPVLILLFSALTVYLLFRSHVEHLVQGVSDSYGIRGLIGLGVVILLPLVGILLMTSILGLFIGLVCIFAYILLMLTAWILSGTVLGALAFRPLTKTSKPSVFSVIIGTFIFGLLPQIPVVGVFAALVIFVITLGGMVVDSYRKFR